MANLTKTDVNQLCANYLKVLNDRDMSQFGAIFDANYVNETRMGTVAGLDNFKGFMSAIYAAFPDIEFAEDETIAEGDLIASRYHWTGTHQGELNGIPATGKQVRVAGMEMNRIENGKIVATWNYADIMGLMQQLGVFPA